MKTEILYEDRDILVVQKPAGLAVQTARSGQPDVVSELKNYLASQAVSEARGYGAGGKAQPYLGVIHRLDQPVEGLLVFAKNKKAAAELTRQLACQGESGGLNKQYYAVFCGKAAVKKGELVDYMYKDNGNRAVILTEVQAATERRAKRAVLQYRVLQETKTQGISLSLAQIHIDTGRFHQIRAQMAHGGMSLVGDLKYGSDEMQAISEKLKIRNVALCACSLEFLHPLTKSRLSFQVKPQGKAFTYFQP